MGENEHLKDSDYSHLKIHIEFPYQIVFLTIFKCLFCLSTMDKHTNYAFKVMNQDFMKLDRFDGTNYTRLKDKMMFFLTALKVTYVLDLNLPTTDSSLFS